MSWNIARVERTYKEKIEEVSITESLRCPRWNIFQRAFVLDWQIYDNNKYYPVNIIKLDKSGTCNQYRKWST